MFCPKCATQNIDGASFCRSCGANISLVPQALSGQLQPTPAPVEDCKDFGFGRRRDWNRQPSIDNAIRSLMMGIAFAVISIMIARFSPGGWTWWYWMLIPAATFLGKGISDFARLKAAKNQAPTVGLPPAQPGWNAIRSPEAPTPRTGELMPPVASVTEGTTRHLGADAQTRHFDSH